MITSRTAKVIMYVVTGVWAFNIVMNGAGVLDTAPELNVIFMAIIAGVIGLRPAFYPPRHSTSTNDAVLEEIGKFQDWWERKFSPEKYRARLHREIAWYEHELNTPAHLLKDCPFCPTPADPDKSFEEQLLDSGATVPLLVPSGHTRMPDGSTKPPLPEKTVWMQHEMPDLTEAELREIHEYIEKVPFMSWEEGDEITERNWAGDIMVTYKTPDSVRCQRCSKRFPHHHKDDDAAMLEEVMASAKCTTCGEPGIHTHSYPSALILDEVEYDTVLG